MNKSQQAAFKLIGFVVLFVVFWIMFAQCGSSSNTNTSGTTSTTEDNSPDGTYLRILKSHVAGITNTEGDAGLIKGGHAICDALQGGETRDEISQQLHHFSASDARWQITASVVVA